MSLSDQSIGHLLAGIASEAPAPGAGSGASVALAVGLACARKALLLTVKHHSDARDLSALDTYLAGLIEQALAGGEADMAAFERYIAAIKAPRDAAAERHALADLLVIDRALIAIGDDARARLLEVKTEIYPAMINDIGAALALIAGARAIHLACEAESAQALNPPAV